MTPEEQDFLLRLLSSGGPWGVSLAMLFVGWKASRLVRDFLLGLETLHRRLLAHWEAEEKALANIEAAVSGVPEPRQWPKTEPMEQSPQERFPGAFRYVPGPTPQSG